MPGCPKVHPVQTNVNIEQHMCCYVSCAIAASAHGAPWQKKRRGSPEPSHVILNRDWALVSPLGNLFLFVEYVILCAAPAALINGTGSLNSGL